MTAKLGEADAASFGPVFVVVCNLEKQFGAGAKKGGQLCVVFAIAYMPAVNFSPL